MMDGKTKVCGIIGKPVEHSMSPVLQGLYAEDTGVNMVYAAFPVEPEDLETAVKGAFALNMLGMNVTSPHKQEVMKYLVEIDETARDIGAVNTLVRRENGFAGFNSDVPGLTRSVVEAGIVMEGRKCIVLGAGGASKGACYMLAKNGAEVVYLLNRTVEKAEVLADFVNKTVGRDVIKPMSISDYSELPGDDYFCIQCTTVGMHPHEDQIPIDDDAFYNKISDAVDCIYTPAETLFMKRVKAAGGHVINGLGMLLYQGIVSYELWNPGTKVSDAAVQKAREVINARINPVTEPIVEKKTEKIDEKAAPKYDLGEPEDDSAYAPKKDIILVGFMAAGKTTVGLKLAEMTGQKFLDTDAMIEEETGRIIKDIFAEDGEQAFRTMETDLIKKLISKKWTAMMMGTQYEGAIYSVGGGLATIAENRPLLKELGEVVLLDVSAEEAYKRLKGEVTKRPMLRSEDGDVRKRIDELMSIRIPLYRDAATMVVSVNDRSPEEIAAEIIERCN